MKALKNKSKLIKPLKNWFVIILIVFAVWMLFFDANSWFIHNDLNNDIEAIDSLWLEEMVILLLTKEK